MLWTAVVFVLRLSASSGFVAPLSAGPFPLRTAPLALRLHLLSNCRHSSQPCRKPASHFMHLSGNLLLWFYMSFLSWEHIDLDHDISDSVSHTLDFQVHARDTRNLLWIKQDLGVFIFTSQHKCSICRSLRVGTDCSFLPFLTALFPFVAHVFFHGSSVPVVLVPCWPMYVPATSL